MELLLCGKMTQDSIMLDLEQLISSAFVELAFSRNEGYKDRRLASYSDAFEWFDIVLDEVKDKEEQLTRYRDRIDTLAKGAAFGCGLIEGLKEYEEKWNGARPWQQVADAAKKFYETQAVIESSTDKDSVNTEHYKAMGKSYASLGLAEEGLQYLKSKLF